ncbi:hypothetical protein AA313_de0205748 [Arthrobotrys entomopaga]|nr:hypothetical protein AA313_de0205748 [Arthrobotrys entomopaga]
MANKSILPNSALFAIIYLSILGLVLASLENHNIILQKRATSTTAVSSSSSCGTPEQHPYYIDGLRHQGFYAQNATYPVYRNIKCYGAKGDGKTDDSDAIIRALSDGKFCVAGKLNCDEFYVPPSVVYFPSGRYLVTKSLPLYRNTQLVGNANDRPVIAAILDFAGQGIIETRVGDIPARGIGDFIVIRNIAIDGSKIPPTKANTTAITWNAGQASGIQNVTITMSSNSNTTHRGILIENSAHSFMTDVSIQQGMIGLDISAQAGLIRGVTIQHSKKSAIKINSNYAITFKGLTLSSTPIGIDASAIVQTSDGVNSQPVNSFVLLEVTASQTPVLVKTARGGSSSYPIGAGSVVLENVHVGAGVSSVHTDKGDTVYGPPSILTKRQIKWWLQGTKYNPSGYSPANLTGQFTPTRSNQSLLQTTNGHYAQKSRPLYANILDTNTHIISVRTIGAKGDGETDDSAKLQKAFDQAAASNGIVFIDYGIYIVTKTLTIRPGTRIVGEAWPKIMASGAFFANEADPQPILKVGLPGDKGLVEIQDVVITTKAGSSGAISYEWHLKGATQNGDMSGMWDSHSIIGAQPNSNLEASQCAHNPRTTSVRSQCIGAFLHMHITKHSAHVYLENTYFASAAYQHTYTSIPSSPLDIYVGRGVFIDSSPGSHFLSGVSADNSVMYQYQIVNSNNVFASMLYGTNPSFQPTPIAPAPFTKNSTWSDPDFSSICAKKTGVELTKCAKAFGLRIVNSDNVLIYSTALMAGGLDNYAKCPPGSFDCQLFMVGVEGQKRAPVDKYANIYGMTTKGTKYGMMLDGKLIIDSKLNAGTSLALPVIAWWYIGGALPA